MGMDRLLKRLREGEPPLRVGELADLIGYSPRGVQRLMDKGALPFVRLHEDGERRIPVAEAAQLARHLGVLKEGG